MRIQEAGLGAIGRKWMAGPGLNNAHSESKSRQHKMLEEEQVIKAMLVVALAVLRLTPCFDLAVWSDLIRWLETKGCQQ